jgi:chromosome segregation protein
MEAAAQAVQEDVLASLEERITRAVQVLTSLREENQQLSEEVDTLRGERKQVKTRIEKLLTQLDLLSAS